MILSLEQNYGATDKQCIYTYILLAEEKKAITGQILQLCVHVCTYLYCYF